MSIYVSSSVEKCQCLGIVEISIETWRGLPRPMVRPDLSRGHNSSVSYLRHKRKGAGCGVGSDRACDALWLVWRSSAPAMYRPEPPAWLVTLSRGPDARQALACSADLGTYASDPIESIRARKTKPRRPQPDEAADRIVGWLAPKPVGWYLVVAFIGAGLGQWWHYRSILPGTSCSPGHLLGSPYLVPSSPSRSRP